MAGGAEEGGEVGWFGCLLVLLAGAGFCAAMRPTQRLIARIGAPAFTSVSIAAASLMCLPFSLALAQSYTVDWSVGMVLSLLYLGLGCGWYAYWLWNKGMSRVPANASGLLISLEPVVGVLLAVLILGEHLSPVSALGVFVVIAATFAVSGCRAGTRKTAMPSEAVSGGISFGFAPPSDMLNLRPCRPSFATVSLFDLNGKPCLRPFLR